VKKTLRTIIILAAIAVAGALINPFFVLPEGEQAVLTRFGTIKKVFVEAGLKVKLPFVDQVIRFSRKTLSWDGDPQLLPTSENQFIWVDTTARWRIVDAKTFYESVTVMSEAYSRLDTVIESAVKTVVSKYSLSESVRSTNTILESDSTALDFQVDASEGGEEGALDMDAGEQSGIEDLTATAFTPIEMGREKLSNEMLEHSQGSMPEYGIELLDIVIRQIRYSDDLTQSVYARMISERQKIATGYRSNGNGVKAEWLGRLNRDRDIILSEATLEAALIRADGDAQAARIYADSYSADSEFYSFWKALESYRATLPGQRKVLSTDMDFFRYLYQAQE